MKFLLILSAVAFVLGAVSGVCHDSDCIDKQKEIIHNRMVPTERFCETVNDVRSCILNITGCSEEDANKAATKMDVDLKFNCTSIPNWENNGKCYGKMYKCMQEYSKTIDGKTGKNEICNAIGVYQKCTTAEGNCNRFVISREMKMMMKRDRIDKCENIEISTCEDFAKEESCLMTFFKAKTELDLAGDKATLCMLAAAVEHCMRTKAKCIHQTIVDTMTKALDKVDCSEYVDLCNHEKEESCNEKNPDNCGKLKDYKTCLTSNASCPAARVHHIMRNVMKDKNLDCEDTSACELVKEEDCDVDATRPETTTEEKCKRFNGYKKCMDRANCNANYMNNRINKMNDQLGHPCGASSILASIGLTLLLAAFAGPWK